MTPRPTNIPLQRISRRPDSLHPSRFESHLDERPEPSPLSAVSCESADIEDYIGSGTDTEGGRTPAILRRLSFGREGSSDDDNEEHHLRTPHHFDVDHSDVGGDDDDMDPTRSSYLRSNDGKSGTPLLLKPDDKRGRSRYNSSRDASPLLTPTSSTGMRTPHHRSTAFARRRSMRSRSPDTAARIAARKKYTYAAFFLVVSLVSFCVQTELAAYVQTELGWNKAYCMLYLTHGSWSLLWPVQLVILRLQKWKMPWNTFWRRHVYLLRSTAQMVRAQELDVPRQMARESPVPYLLRTTAFVTTALTIAGLSWYVAVDMTSPSDLTAIYNCSAFFAYAFSVPLLREKLRLDKSLAVLIAIVGVLVVAYGDTKSTSGDEAEAQLAAGTRFVGNMIIGLGSILYGLYEVLYKRWACPPEGVSANRGMIFANAFGSCIGLFTLTVLWIPLPVLHIIGWEKFELPTGQTALWLWISVIMNASFAGSFLVLISLTSPVLSSVAALLTIFLVAIVDWLRTGEAMSAAAILGGIMIIVAFVMLSWSTWREMTEDAERKAGEAEFAYEESSDEDDKDDASSDRLD